MLKTPLTIFLIGRNSFGYVRLFVRSMTVITANFALRVAEFYLVKRINQ